MKTVKGQTRVQVYNEALRFYNGSGMSYSEMLRATEQYTRKFFDDRPADVHHSVIGRTCTNPVCPLCRPASYSSFIGEPALAYSLRKDKAGTPEPKPEPESLIVDVDMTPEEVKTFASRVMYGDKIVLVDGRLYCEFAHSTSYHEAREALRVNGEYGKKRRGRSNG